LEDSKQYHSIEPLHEEIEDDQETYGGSRRPSTPARYEQFHRQNSTESDKYYYPPQPPQPIDIKPLLSPIRKSYSYDQALNDSNNVLNRPNKDVYSRSPEAMKPSMPPVSPKQNFTNLHRSYSNGIEGYPVMGSPLSPSNSNLPLRSPKMRINNQRPRSPSNVHLTNSISHLPIPINNSNNTSYGNLSKSLPTNNNLNSSNGSLNNSSSNLNTLDGGIRYYSELSAYELITVKHMAINTIKECLDNNISLDLSSLIEDRKLNLWEKVFVSFKSNQKKTKSKGNNNYKI